MSTLLCPSPTRVELPNACAPCGTHVVLMVKGVPRTSTFPLPNLAPATATVSHGLKTGLYSSDGDVPLTQLGLGSASAELKGIMQGAATT